MGHQGLRFDPGLVHHLQVVDFKRLKSSPELSFEPRVFLLTSSSRPDSFWSAAVELTQRFGV